MNLKLDKLAGFLLVAIFSGFVSAGPLLAASENDGHSSGGHDTHAGAPQGGDAHGSDPHSEAAPPKKHVPVYVWQREPKNAPYKIVRKITELQNRIVHGDRAAFDILQARLVSVSEELIAVDTALWITDLRNARAALKFVMSGGPPDILRRLIKEAALPTRYLEPATAILAYSEGRKADAYRLLRETDPRALEATLGGHLALIKALTIGSRRSDEVRKLLDDARLLSPGTIVEESALRRQIPLEAMQPDNGEFDMLTSRYLRRFSQSVFARGLLLQVAETVARDDYGGGDPKKLSVLRGFLDQMRPSQRTNFLLSVARAATARGLAATTKFAVEEARKSEPPPLLEDDAPLQLYGAAMGIIGGEYEKDAQKLEAVDDELLTVEQSDLRKTAIGLKKMIRRWPETPEVKDEAKFEAENGGPLQWPEAAAAKESAAQGQDLIASIDKLLLEIDQ